MYLYISNEPYICVKVKTLNKKNALERYVWIVQSKNELSPFLFQVNCLVHGAVLTLPSSACDGAGDIIFELMKTQHDMTSQWIELSLKQLTDAGSDAPGITAAAPHVAHQQLIAFYKAVTAAEQPCQIADALYELSRFWR